MKKTGLFLIGILIVAQGFAQAWVLKQTLGSNDLSAGDGFGSAVSICGQRIVVGARAEDENAIGDSTLTNAGSACFFRWNEDYSQWEQEQKIVSPIRAEYDNFGRCAVISGD